MPILPGHNVQRRITIRGGLIGLLEGDSLSSATGRAIYGLNNEGYRVAFLIQDQWNLARVLLNTLVTVVTLGVVSSQPGLLIVGERAATDGARP